MLRTFGVSRTLSKAGRDALPKKLDLIAERYKKDPETQKCSVGLKTSPKPDDWKTIFDLTTSPNEDYFIQGSKTTNGKYRDFVSGLTKVLWFMGIHEMPMFDTYTCRAVKPTGKNQVEKAISFYNTLMNTSWDYPKLHQSISQLTETSKNKWFFPERFLDKLLLFKGLGSKEFKNRALMGTCDRRDVYLQSLPGSRQSELSSLKTQICDTMGRTEFKKWIES